jgi:hypothetical protein
MKPPYSQSGAVSVINSTAGGASAGGAASVGASAGGAASVGASAGGAGVGAGWQAVNTMLATTRKASIVNKDLRFIFSLLLISLNKMCHVYW